MTNRCDFRAGILACVALACHAPAPGPRPVANENPSPLAPAELRRVVEVIAHDSMAGRPTPSRELNLASEYIAAAFTSAGLSPLGDDGTFFQRFPVSETVVDQQRARLEIGSMATWRFGADYWHIAGMGGAPFGELRGPVVIVSGKVNRETAPTLDVNGKIVIYRSPVTARGTPSDVVAGFALGAAHARAVLIPGRRSERLWDAISRDHDELKPLISAAWPVWTANAPPMVAGAIKFMPVLEVWNGRFDALLARAGIDSSTFAAPNATPKVTPLNVDGRFSFDRIIERVTWAPNVVGVLTGSDPVLRNEYVVVSAHLDGLGRSLNGPPGPQTVLNGADDNASGVAAIVQMAKALAGGARPKRSVIFLAVAGEELGLWGSDYFVARPPVPQRAIVADVNLDMVGRAVGDSVYVTGREHATLKSAVASVLASGTRGLVLLDERALDTRYPNERLDERSDHENFRRRGIPALSFYTGSHVDYHETTDDVDKLNFVTLSRIAGLALDLTRAVADAPLPPRSPR